MLDRVFCVWRLPNGSLRRVDIIVVPYIEWPFALLSWTGSKVRTFFLMIYIILVILCLILMIMCRYSIEWFVTMQTPKVLVYQHMVF